MAFTPSGVWAFCSPLLLTESGKDYFPAGFFRHTMVASLGFLALRCEGMAHSGAAQGHFSKAPILDV